MSDRKVGTVAKRLIEAKKLIDTPDKWIKGSYYHAEDFFGIRKMMFCAVGAIYQAGTWEWRNEDTNTPMALYRPEDHIMANEAVEYLHSAACHPGGIEGFNDDETTTHEEIMAVFDKAISAALAKGE